MNLPKPLNDTLLIQRDKSDTTSGGIAIPERNIGFVDSSCKLLQVGIRTSGLDRGRPYSEILKPGDTLLHSKMVEGYEEWQSESDPSIQLIKLGYVFGFARDGHVRAYGRRVLVKRAKNARFKNEDDGDILLANDPQCLYAEFISLGVSADPFRTKGLVDLRIGDRVKLTKWSEDMHELNLKGDYYLIVPEEMIEVTFEGVLNK